MRQSRERGVPVKTYTVPRHEIDRALIDGEERGFVKIHVRDSSDEILGATVVAHHASEMINGLSLAMVAGINLSTIARVMHTYPTQAQDIKKAAMAQAAVRRLGRWVR